MITLRSSACFLVQYNQYNQFVFKGAAPLVDEVCIFYSKVYKLAFQFYHPISLGCAYQVIRTHSYHCLVFLKTLTIHAVLA